MPKCKRCDRPASERLNPRGRTPALCPDCRRKTRNGGYQRRGRRRNLDLRYIVAERLRMLLAERGETPTAFARRADLCDRTLQGVLAGPNGASLMTVVEVADALDVSLDWLCGRTEVRECPRPKSGPAPTAEATDVAHSAAAR